MAGTIKLHKDLTGADLHINKVHAHVKADITDFPALGTASPLDVPASGNASAAQVVKGDDTRLSGGGTVTAVTGTSPVVSSEGTTPAISLPAATNAAPGHATAAQIAALEAATAAQHAIATIGTANGLSLAGQALSLAAATASVPGAATAAQITKLNGIATGATANVGTVTGVTATAPVTSSGGAAPAIALPAATASVDGYETKKQVTKLDGIATGANAYVRPNHSGDVTSTADGATVIAAGAVDLAMMANIATAKLIGRATAETGVPELIDLTAAGRALLDDANSAAQIVTLGLDADIATLSLPASTTITAAAQTILDDASVGAIIATLGASPLAPTGATYTPATGAQTVALDVTTVNMHVVTGHADGTAITLSITGATNNQPFVVSILQGGTTVSTITAWFATVRWAGGTAPTLTAALNKRDTFGFIRTGANTYDGFVIGQNA